MEGKDISHSYTEDKIYGRVDLLEKTIMYTHRREDDKNIAFETINTFRDAYAAGSRFYINLADSFVDASLIPLRNLCRIKPVQKPEDIEKVNASKVRDSFDRNFREEIFVKSLAELLDSHSRLAKLMGLGKTYQGVSNLNSLWNTVFLEPLRDTAWRSPSHKIYSENKYALFHSMPTLTYLIVQHRLLIRALIPTQS